MKKLFSIILAVCMIAGMITTASAARSDAVQRVLTLLKTRSLFEEPIFLFFCRIFSKIFKVKTVKITVIFVS